MLGVVSLLVALAVVAVVARTQLRPVAVASTTSGSAPAAAVARGARDLEEKARTDVERALREGARRTEDADR